MLNRSLAHRIAPLWNWLAAVALLAAFASSLPALAQTEPTLKQIYDTAQAGQLDRAQVMVQQVLVLHPNSAKAHFVQAELFAQQGQLPKARESLATAEKLAPGLPFAKSEGLQSLRVQLEGKGSAPAAKTPSGSSFGAATPAVPPAASTSLPWGAILALGGAAIALVVFLMRRKPAQTFTPPASYANAGNPQGNGLNGPQTFGMAAGTAPGTPGMPGPAGYGQPGQMPGQPYAQPQAGSGMGGRLAGGLATGLAVGAGMMAAQAIGKTLSGNEEHGRGHDGAGNNSQPLSNNTGNANNDMGGQNFGVEDNGSWDDAGASGDLGGGGDWDT